MIWSCLPFQQLTNTDLYSILQLRSEIFVVEQNCVYLDLDGADINCYHLFTKDEDGKIVAYCRIVPPGLHYTEPSIGRVITSSRSRKKGIGIALMQEAIAATYRIYTKQPIQIGAQHYLLKFYENLGFKQSSGIYDEDGIDHIKMILP